MGYGISRGKSISIIQAELEKFCASTRGLCDKYPTEYGYANKTSSPTTPDKPAFTDSLASSMVEVRGGTLKMGSKAGTADEQPVHNVTVSTFWLSRYEVTIGQYLAFCTETDSHWPVWLEKGHEYNVETGIDTFYKDQT